MPPKIPVNYIVGIEDALKQRDDISFEGALEEILDVNVWSATL